MNGMDSTTGKPVNGIAALRQRVENILRTPPESMVLHRDYGSELFALIDAPLTESVRMLIITATVNALDEWEPELQTTRVTFPGDSEQVRSGHVSINLEGYYMPTGEPVVLEGIELL